MPKYYTFDLMLEPEQLRKMLDAWDECIGPGQPDAGLFAFVNFKKGTLRGMIMPPEVCSQFKPALKAALSIAQNDELGSL